MLKKYPRYVVAILSLLIVVCILMLLPVAPNFDFTCPLSKASAQDNPCLSHEVTIGAQKVAILELQATNNAQAAQIINLQSTNDELSRSKSNSIVITVPILITTTPAPTLNAQVTSSPNDVFATIENSSVEIVEVISVGDLGKEGITIRNHDSKNINLGDWSLSDSLGNELYVFGERILFSNGLVTIYSRTGDDTAISLFMSRQKSAFVSGTTIILKDAKGDIQSTYKLS